MHEHITAAGFVVCNNEAIWGVGETSDKAWSNFVTEMASSPGIVILGETEEIPAEPCNWVRESDYKIRPASEALIDLVEREGGDVAWAVARGVLCTVEEFEAQ
jgi:hypothetical protein